MEVSFSDKPDLSPDEWSFFNKMQDKTNLFLGYFGIPDDPNLVDHQRLVIPILGAFTNTDDDHPTGVIYRIGLPFLISSDIVPPVADFKLGRFGCFTSTNPCPEILTSSLTFEIVVDEDLYYSFTCRENPLTSNSFESPYEKIVSDEFTD